MKKNNTFSPQTMLYFRIFAGGYLMYLSWDLYKEMPEGLLYWIPVIAFAVIGFAIAVLSVRDLVQMNRQEAEEAARLAAEAAAREEGILEENLEEPVSSDL